MNIHNLVSKAFRKPFVKQITLLKKTSDAFDFTTGEASSTEEAVEVQAISISIQEEEGKTYRKVLLMKEDIEKFDHVIIDNNEYKIGQMIKSNDYIVSFKAYE